MFPSYSALKAKSFPSGEKWGLDSMPSLMVSRLDGVRADSLDGAGFLGALAGEAVRFDRAFAQAPDVAASTCRGEHHYAPLRAPPQDDPLPAVQP